MTQKEDFGTGTAAAAAGGVTCAFDMPNTLPPTDSAARLADKRAMAEEKALIDFGLYGLLGEHNLAELPAMAEAGMIGTKLFLGNTTGDNPCPSDGAVLEGFEILAALGTALFHPCREFADPVLAAEPAEGSGAERSPVPSRRAHRRRGHRGAEPRGDAGRLDGRAHPHRARKLRRHTDDGRARGRVEDIGRRACSHRPITAESAPMARRDQRHRLGRARQRARRRRRDDQHRRDQQARPPP
jgi:hypothetical protein